MNNRLIKEEINEDGKTIYKMATFEIDVIAKLTGGLAPTIIYMHKEREVTDDIRAIRFHYENPASYIEDYTKFQIMLFQKEQRAMNELYESISLKPKNMSTGKQILWSFWVLLLVSLPLLVVMWIVK
ncbi:sodium:proton antiporter [Solibacillus sp. FSL H8-0538]|uniref:sodium:proton antiporter n=1 Tax=Solibacillus sp. FSL H8-0538 TaxID=2921400 RepID=UPI0030F81051